MAAEENSNGGDAFAIVGTTPVGEYGNGIYQWSENAWKQLPGAAWRIGGAINPWITGGDGIYCNVSDLEWKEIHSKAIDITKYGSHVWKIAPPVGSGPNAGEVNRWDWATTKWKKAGEVKVKAIAVGGNGVQWVVLFDDRIMRFRP